MYRSILVVGGLYGALAVGGGAIGAHRLAADLAPGLLVSYHTAVQYLLVHAVALTSIACWMRIRPRSRWFLAGAIAMAIGTGLFSGGLVGWSVWGQPWLRALAPWGGSILILAWVTLAIAGWRDRNVPELTT